MQTCYDILNAEIAREEKSIAGECCHYCGRRDTWTRDEAGEKVCKPCAKRFLDECDCGQEGCEICDPVQLAMKAIGKIDAMDEKATMNKARADVRQIAADCDMDAETLWKAACEGWYAIGRAAKKSNTLFQGV